MGILIKSFEKSSQHTGFGNGKLACDRFENWCKCTQMRSEARARVRSMTWLRLTSLPTRSSWFSTMPHGAIPMVQIFPLDLEAWSFSASPTCRITPVYERLEERRTKTCFVTIDYQPNVTVIHSAASVGNEEDRGTSDVNRRTPPGL